MNAMIKPAAPYVLTAVEFYTFCTRIKSLKLPSGYCSELSNAIQKRKFGALKTHDYHIIMQHLLPFALRWLIEENTCVAIMRSSRMFCRLSYRTWNPSQHQNLEDDVAIMMAMMDITFLPNFFDVMSHMPHHLLQDLDTCVLIKFIGCIQLRGT